MTDKLRIRQSAEIFTKNSADNKLSSFLMSRLSGMLGNHEISPAAEGTLPPAHADARHGLRERPCMFPHRGDAACDLRSGHCSCALLHRRSCGRSLCHGQNDIARCFGYSIRTLRRAAKVARQTARMHGTPIYIWKNGKVVAEKP